MSSIFKRLADVARSYIQTGDQETVFKTGQGPDGGHRTRSRSDGSQGRGAEGHSRSSARRQAPRANHGGTPQQVVEDLAVFNLTPPSSMEAVKNARNREIKKYHSDKFLNDPERLETSKEIMQIYNAAYDRLQAYYKK